MFNHLREDIRNILQHDPAARSTWEVLTCYSGLHAIVMHRWAHYCWQHGFFWLGRFISHVACFFTGVEIHPGAKIGRRVFIDHGFGVVIGETAEVGDDCTIYQGVTLGGTSLAKGAKRHPTLERGVIVGAGAKVLGDFSVGEGAKIGSNSVVVKAVAAGATVAGNPARMLTKGGIKQENELKDAEFFSYGLTDTADDPISKTVNSLTERVAFQERQILSLQLALKRAGIEIDATAESQKEPIQLDVKKRNKVIN